MSPPDRVRLRHMLDALESARRFAKDRERNDLNTDEMLLFALVQAITIAGEAASRISPQSRGEMPDLPWDSIVGMRNRLVHAYFDIDRDVVWATVTQAVPPLIALLTEFLANQVK